MENILIYKDKSYSENDILSAAGKIAYLIKQRNMEKDIAINVYDIFEQTAAVIAVWNLGLGAYIINSDYPYNYRNAISEQYIESGNYIDDDFISEAFNTNKYIEVTAIWSGKLIINGFENKNVKQYNLFPEDLSLRYNFMRNTLKLKEDKIYILSRKSIYLRFFGFENNMKAIFDNDNFSEKSCVVLPSYMVKDLYKKMIENKISSVLSYGCELYDQNIRDELKKAGIKVYNIFDMPSFGLITSGTDTVAIPVNGVKATSWNALGKTQSVGMKGYLYIENIRNEKIFSGYECITMKNGKYKLDYFNELAYANGEPIPEEPIIKLLTEKLNCAIYDVKIKAGVMKIYINSDKAISYLVNIISSELPENYSSVILIKSSAKSNTDSVYTSEDVKNLIDILTEMDITDVNIDLMFDENYSMVIEGSTESINKIDSMLTKSRSINKVVFKNLQTGEINNRDYFELNDLQKEVHKVFIKYLQDDNFEFYDNFFEHGGTSLMFIKLYSELEKITSNPIDTNTFFANATPQFYCRMIENKNTENGIIQMADHRSKNKDDILINDSQLFEFTPENKPAEEKGIFMTGCTGFLGTFLLVSLLEKTTSNIYCLVRAENKQDATDKINNSLKKYHFDRYCNNSRIIVILGNLDRVKLGMSNEDYQFILYHANKIVHNGAKVDFMYTYEMLKKTNVDSVREVIQIAAHGAQKEIHYVSTLAVLEDLRYNGTADEDFDSFNYPPVIFGYNQSKWVGDVLIQRAIKYGIKANIYRIATAGGDTVYGNWQSNDLVRSICSLCIKLGATPEFAPILHLVPVDRLANLISYCVTHGVEDKGRILHLGGGTTIDTELLAKWVNEYNMTMRIADESEWQKIASEYINNNNSTKDMAIFRILYKSDEYNVNFESEVITKKTDKYFEKLGLNYKAVTQDEFNKYLENIKNEINN